tara:strand:- start:7163 stop:7411 length:249 start_codon:yes stop_codon:yes gene_type:complete
MSGKLVYTDTGIMYEDAEGNQSAPTQDQIDQFNSGDAAVPIEDFEQLLGKLEGSKMRQQRQKSVEGRRDVYSQGLSSMMSNF